MQLRYKPLLISRIKKNKSGITLCKVTAFFFIFKFRPIDNKYQPYYIEESQGHKCNHCEKVRKSKGGLKLHSSKKHPELNNCAEPGYTRMATENLSSSQLEDMVKEILDNLSKD